MIDIISASDGEDIGIYNTDVERAKNILSIQLGALTYIPDFGVDLKYFLNEAYEFQNDSFKSYLVDRLANYGINVSSVVEVVEALSSNLTFNIGLNQSSDGLIAR